MLTTLISFLNNFWELTSAMSFYMLLGLFIAGIIKQLIPDNFVSSHLGKNSITSVIKATILGIPLPVCSCSVVPLAKSLEKEGASKGAVQSFLISTPITGVDSIMATYSFFGAIFTIYRVITSIIIAIIAGILQNLIKDSPQIKKKEEENNKLQIKVKSCCSNDEIHPKIHKEVKSCCSSNKKEKFSIKKVFEYAYITLFKDIAKALFIGLLIGASFTTFLPKDLLNIVFENHILTYAMILVISLPMYVCATSSLPIVASLMLSGMSGGAGFIFLSAGPATNSVTMGVVTQMFGKKSLFIYLGVISVLSIAFGMILDIFLPNISILSINNHGEHLNPLNIIPSILMLGLIAYFIIKPIFKKEKKSCCCHDDSCC
jgi:hypothetical protein